MKNPVKLPRTQIQATFSDWLQTHENHCRQMVRLTCLRSAAIMRSTALECDDVWGDICLKLQMKNPRIPNEPALMKLVQICATNHIRDKGRKNRTRQSIIADFVETGDEESDFVRFQFRDYDSDKSHQADDLLEETESFGRLKEIGMSDPETAPVFRAICALEESGRNPSIVNLAKYLGRPYANVRRSRLRLQETVRRALLADSAYGMDVRQPLGAVPLESVRSYKLGDTHSFR